MNDQNESIRYLAEQYFRLEKEAEESARRRDAVKWQLKQELFALYAVTGMKQIDPGFTVTTKTEITYDVPSMHSYLMREPVRNAGLLRIGDFAYPTAVGLLASNPVFAGSLELDASKLHAFVKKNIIGEMGTEFDGDAFRALTRRLNYPDMPVEGFSNTPDNIQIGKTARSNIPAASFVDEALVKAALKAAPKKTQEGGDAGDGE